MTSLLPISISQDYKISLAPKTAVFVLLLIIVYLLSGVLTMLTMHLGLPRFRMGIMSLIVIPLVLVYGIKLDFVLFLYFLLFIEILLSAYFNNSSLMDIISFSRTLVFSYLMYWIVEKSVQYKHTRDLLRFFKLLAIIQLPIILLQRYIYVLLPYLIQNDVTLIDIGFGTFNYKDDVSMAFFLALFSTLILFNRRVKSIVKHPWFILVWSTLTIFIANAQIVQLIILGIWGWYLLSSMNFKVIAVVSVVFCLVIMIIAVFGQLENIWSNLYDIVQKNLNPDATQLSNYLRGGYGRGAAILYYIRSDILWWGDGPSAYYNVFDRINIRGNTGHIFTFYTELGLLGWLVSLLILFFMSVQLSLSNTCLSWVKLLGFFSIFTLGFTTNVMNDISIILTYCLILKLDSTLGKKSLEYIQLFGN